MIQKPKIIKGRNFDILEYRRGKYAKIVNGQVVGKASKYDVEEVRMQTIVGELDAGLIEVTLALSAVSALLTTENNILPVQKKFMYALNRHF